MRRLAHPRVVASAVIAAALSTVFSLPRMLLWESRKLPVWYLEATVFLGGFVLWSFVFAWHTEYTGRPVFTLKIKPSVFAAATAFGIIAAFILHFFLDPTVRRITPGDFPIDFEHWVASVLFSLAFTQLFLLYAPFAWLMRLFRNEQAAIWLTVTLEVAVLIMRNHSISILLPAMLFAELLVLRIVLNYLGLWFYLRGGIFLVWWIDVLMETRHLFEFWNK